MPRTDETYWHCTSRDCGMTAACEETERSLETRICDCGNLMKRETHAAVFAYLNFLREETCSETADVNEKEETPCKS
jgi:hypothetical protein